MPRERRYRGGPWIGLAIVLAAATAALAPLPATAIETWFSNGIYPRLQPPLTGLSNVTPVAWLDVVSITATVWVAWVWWRAFRADGTRRLPRIGRASSRTVVAAATVYLLFLVLWGFNYRRVPLPERLSIEHDAPSTDAVVALGHEVAARLNGLYAPAHNSGFHEIPSRNASLRAAFANVQQQLGSSSPALPGRLKRTLFGSFFRWTGVDGMINPFGLEVLANPDLLPFERPFVAAHEWAHLAGYADESEANFVGWLTSIHADQASQYSGWLYLYWQIAGEVPAAGRQSISAALTAGPRDDLAAIAARLRRGDLPALRRASWMMYDRYLKANRVEEGVRSYGAVVTLILRARFEDGWRPVLEGHDRKPSP